MPGVPSTRERPCPCLCLSCRRPPAAPGRGVLTILPPVALMCCCSASQCLSCGSAAYCNKAARAWLSAGDAPPPARTPPSCRDGAQPALGGWRRGARPCLPSPRSEPWLQAVAARRPCAGPTVCPETRRARRRNRRERQSSRLPSPTAAEQTPRRKRPAAVPDLKEVGMLDVEPPSCSSHPESSERGTRGGRYSGAEGGCTARGHLLSSPALPTASEAEK